MPKPTPKRARIEIAVLVTVVAIVGALMGALGSSANPSTSKLASDAAPKPTDHSAAQADEETAASAGKSASVAAPAPSDSAPAATEAPSSSPPAERRSSTTAAPPAPAPAPVVEVPNDENLPVFAVPASIDATGGRDVTDELLAFVASVPDGSVIRFPAGATYRAEGSLKIENRNNLVFDGQGSTIIADSTADRNRRHWWFRGGSNITIRDMAVRGANPNAGTGDAAYVASLEAQHGFDFGGVDGVLLERVSVTDVYGDFVYLGLVAGQWTKNAIVRDSHFERNGRQGIAITGAEDVLITHNFISETRRSTFDIEPNAAHWGARNVQIIENQIGPGRLLFLAAVGNPYGTVSDILIENNTLSGRGMNMIVSGGTDPGEARRSNFRIINNRSDSEWGNGGGALMTFTAIDGVEVSGNIQPLQPRRGNAGVATRASCDVAVGENVFPNAVQEHRPDAANC